MVGNPCDDFSVIELVEFCIMGFLPRRGVRILAGLFWVQEGWRGCCDSGGCSVGGECFESGSGCGERAACAVIFM